MTMKKLAAIALLLPLTLINASVFACDQEQTEETKEGERFTELGWTLAGNEQQTDEQGSEKPESSEYTLSENDNTESEEGSTEEDRG